jgi:hypothetical protein
MVSRDGLYAPLVRRAGGLTWSAPNYCALSLAAVRQIWGTEEKVKALLPTLDSTMSSGLATLENVQVLQYGSEMRI